MACCVVKVMICIIGWGFLTLHIFCCCSIRKRFQWLQLTPKWKAQCHLSNNHYTYKGYLRDVETFTQKHALMHALKIKQNRWVKYVNLLLLRLDYSGTIGQCHVWWHSDRRQVISNHSIGNVGKGDPPPLRGKDFYYLLHLGVEKLLKKQQLKYALLSCE